ncbi:MAG: hypothetical protein K9L28_10115, partial [Synergistales bacterium]|nr:hypothetical protein [Synergistales bacterium]
GYDGVDLFAVQNSYGGPQGLKRLVDACHHRGLAVLLDVVYNHLGPEGNYLREFGPYFTDRYRTPWGDALNFDGPGSDQVRRFFIENALYWSRCYHIDALRLDAIHAIVDSSACPFLEELAAAARRHAEQQGRPFHLIAETDRNDPTPVRSPEAGGYGMSAQWSDDFHHSVHALLTGERSGYYADFGPLDRLHKALERTYVLDGCHSVFRRRRHGRPCPDQPPRRFVVAIQNHDQVGNRLRGARLNTLLSFEARKLAAGLLLLAPFVPLLFMGEEYGEPHPFRYFTSHGDPELIRAVGEGRKAEFASFGWGEEPPDPQDEATFLQSRLQWELRNEGRHGTLRRYYRRLITLRKGPLHCTDRREQLVSSDSAAGLLTVRLRNDHGEVFCLYNCSTSSHSAAVGTPGAGRRWTRLLESSAGIWDGPGGSAPETIGNADALRFRMPATSLVVYHKDCEVNR